MADSTPTSNDKPNDKATRQSTVADTEHVESEGDEEVENEVGEQPAATTAGGKKKKSKRKRIKAALTGGDSGSKDAANDGSKLLGSLSGTQIQELLKMNPALAQELGVDASTDLTTKSAQEAMKKLKLEDVMAGLASSGKNVKDMASYKFWGTQPVPKFGDKSDKIEEGPFKIIDREQVPKTPGPLIDGFEWVTMDMTSETEIEEVYTLLYGHYVEDEEAMFRFNYSRSFLHWALLSPGWKKEWHVGIRATASRKLVAFISAIPVELRVRKKVLHASEVNFLCIHKKLRSKRLTPVLIKEITRRCYVDGVYQAIYTAGVVLPTPVSTCRYFHRSLDWQKLYEVGFSPLPANSKPQYQVRRYALPTHTATKGLRPMEAKDIDGVLSLLKRFLAKFDMAPVFTREEVEHWLFHKKVAGGEQVVWAYVVEDPSTKAVADFFSFYCLESSVINNPIHKNVRAAYLFYYASEMALTPAVPEADYSVHLNTLINDALILAKKYKFDVFNALTLQDNNLFLEQQKFGAGDGQLHFYLYNYLANPIAGGVDERNRMDAGLSGMGVVML